MRLYRVLKILEHLLYFIDEPICRPALEILVLITGLSRKVSDIPEDLPSLPRDFAPHIHKECKLIKVAGSHQHFGI